MKARELIELVAPNGTNTRLILANMIDRHGITLGGITQREFVASVQIAATQVALAPAQAEAAALRFEQGYYHR